MKTRGTTPGPGGLAARIGLIAAIIAAASGFAHADGEPDSPNVNVPLLTLDESAPATQSKPDKSIYNLFNPTPNSMLRDFNTDRPDVTESPFTVDAGHYQLEFSFLEYTRDAANGIRTDGLAALPANLRVGVLNNVEVDLITLGYQNVLVHGHSGSRHISQRTSGIGDTQLRAKINFWGNDGGVIAGGIIPFVKIPTGTGGNSNHHLEGGVILPLAINLPWDFDLGTQAEFDCNRNESNNGYGLDFIHTITLGHPLFSDKLNAYIEYVGDAPVDTKQTYLAYFDTGVTYLIMANVQMDAGVNIGISGRADDYLFFSGLSLRF